MARRSLGALVVVVVLVATGPALARATSDHSSVVVMTPKVEVRAKGARTFSKVATTAPVRVGTTVRTGAAGLAEIDYGEGSFTRLDHNTKFVIKKLTTKTGARQIATRLLSGKTFNRVSKLTESESFVQSTKSAFAGVVGTKFAVSWDTSKQISTYTLVTGTLTLRTRGHEQPLLLTAGERVTIVNGIPGPVEALTPGELCADSWICANK